MEHRGQPDTPAAGGEPPHMGPPPIPYRRGGAAHAGGARRHHQLRGAGAGRLPRGQRLPRLRGPRVGGGHRCAPDPGVGFDSIWVLAGMGLVPDEQVNPMSATWKPPQKGSPKVGTKSKAILLLRFSMQIQGGLYGFWDAL